MRVSIVTPCKNSQEAIDRIIQHYNTLDMSGIEWIIVDHASDPELIVQTPTRFKVRIRRHDDNTPWIISTLTNLGADCASGEYFMLLDIDTWISSEWIEFARKRTDNYAVFAKKVAMLDENGLMDEVNNQAHMRSGVNWVKREVFEYLGGYDIKFDGLHFMDTDFRMRYVNYFAQVNGNSYAIEPAPISLGPPIYTWPEKVSQNRPQFIHAEPKDFNLTKVRQIMNGRYPFFTLKGQVPTGL